jgi:hypothetical protein
MSNFSPKFRTPIKSAIEKVAKDLDILYEEHMQDWAYTQSNAADIAKYIDYYNRIDGEDEKFVVMELVLQALEEQEDTGLFNKCSAIIKTLLLNNFKLHEYTIFYWACIEDEDLMDGFMISPLMKEIWSAKYKQ